MFVDTHAHLTAREFDGDRDEVIRRAADAGVVAIINPGTDLADSRKAVELADRHPGVYACVGIHPHDAAKAGGDAVKALEELSRHPKVVAIGEIGLDFHYTFSPPSSQEEIFQAQLAIAVRRNLPVVVHTREAEERTIAILDQAIAGAPAWRTAQAQSDGRFPAPRGVIHCFPGNPAMAWRVIGMGFSVSLPGTVTFKKSGNAAAVAAAVSPEHLLLETDSPYLAPVPHRGKRNEPAYLPLVAGRIAELQHLSVEDIARTTRYGAYALFGIGEPPPPAITYRLRNSLYINLTLRCNADCVFCDRKGDAIIKGHNLKIEQEPSPEDVIAAIGDPAAYEEIVFCGYGEPTIRLDAVRVIAAWVKQHGGRTRLNTDGHGSLINKRNIVPELVGIIDAVSISLNSADPAQYGALMRIDPERYFPAMIDFARESVHMLPRVMMTIVDLPGVDQEKARRLIEEKIGATFVTRPYF